MEQKALFITLEGPDGSGKSSQIGPLVNYLRQQGLVVYATREPGGTEVSDQIRQVIMDLKNKSMHPRAETLLFCAARAQLVEQEIRPRLARGEIVISDRYADSTLAYQGYGHQRDRKQLIELLNYTTGGLWPDFTLLLDVDAETGLRRRRSGGGEWNRLDDYDLAFHNRVRQGYLEMVSMEPTRWQVINANRSRQQIQADLRKAVVNRIQHL